MLTALQADPRSVHPESLAPVENLLLVLLTPGANLRPVSTTPAELVANLPPVSLILVVRLDLRISLQIFKKKSK
jgi:hypothetical protein